MTVFSLELNSIDEENGKENKKYDVNLPNGLVQNLRSKFMALIEIEKMETDDKLKMRKFKSLENIDKKGKGQNVHQSLENLLDEKPNLENMNKLEEKEALSYDFASLQSKFGKPILTTKRKQLTKSLNDINQHKEVESNYVAENYSKVQQIRKLFSKKLTNNKALLPCKSIRDKVSKSSESLLLNEKKTYSNCAIIKPILHGKSLRKSSTGVYYYYNNERSQNENGVKHPSAFLVNIPDNNNTSSLEKSIILRAGTGVRKPATHSTSYNTSLNNQPLPPPHDDSEGYWKISRDLVHKIRAKGKSYRFENGKKQELPTTIFPIINSNNSNNQFIFSTNDEFVDILNESSNIADTSYSYTEDSLNNNHEEMSATNHHEQKQLVNEINGQHDSCSRLNNKDNKRCKTTTNIPRGGCGEGLDTKTFSSNNNSYCPSQVTKLFFGKWGSASAEKQRISQDHFNQHYYLEDVTDNNYHPKKFRDQLSIDRFTLLSSGRNMGGADLEGGEEPPYEEVEMGEGGVLLEDDQEGEDEDLESLTEEDYKYLARKIRVQGAYVKLAKTCFLSLLRKNESRTLNHQRNRITFDSSEPVTFEYPSEQCLLDIALENENVRTRIQAFNERAAQATAASKNASSRPPTAGSVGLKLNSSSTVVRSTPVVAGVTFQDQFQKSSFQTNLIANEDDVKVSAVTADKVISSTYVHLQKKYPIGRPQHPSIEDKKVGKFHSIIPEQQTSIIDSSSFPHNESTELKTNGRLQNQLPAPLCCDKLMEYNTLDEEHTTKGDDHKSKEISIHEKSTINEPGAAKREFKRSAASTQQTVQILTTDHHDSQKVETSCFSYDFMASSKHLKFENNDKTDVVDTHPTDGTIIYHPDMAILRQQSKCFSSNLRSPSLSSQSSSLASVTEDLVSIGSADFNNPVIKTTSLDFTLISSPIKTTTTLDSSHQTINTTSSIAQSPVSSSFSSYTTNTSKTSLNLKLGRGPNSNSNNNLTATNFDKLGTFTPKHHYIKNNDRSCSEIDFFIKNLENYKDDNMSFVEKSSINKAVVATLTHNAQKFSPTIDVSFDSNTSSSTRTRKGEYDEYSYEDYSPTNSSDDPNYDSYLRHHLKPLAIENENELSAAKWSSTVQCADLLF